MSFLDDMIARRRISLERDCDGRPLEALDEEALRCAAALPVGPLSPTSPVPPVSSASTTFVDVMRGGADVAVIAEVKKASPALGAIAPTCDAAARARAYERAGASAISVLTEPDVFLGSFADLAAVSRQVRVPVLCKDFVVDVRQIALARACGASAVLLMASVLGTELARYVLAAHERGLTPLVEVASAAELTRALACIRPLSCAESTVIVVNAREFEALSVDPERQCALVMKAAGAGALVVAASGISRRENVEAAARAGASAVLVGEMLMTAPVIEDALKTVRGVAKVGKEHCNV